MNTFIHEVTSSETKQHFRKHTRTQEIIFLEFSTFALKCNLLFSGCQLRVNCQTRAAAPRARCMKFFENLRNPARIRRAGLVRKFRSGQLDSIFLVISAKLTFA